MFAFLKRTLERRCKLLELEAKPFESAESMDISDEFLEILRMSLQAKDFNENNESSEEKETMIHCKVVQDKLDKLLHDINTRALNVKYDEIIALAVAYYNLGLAYINSEENFKLHIAFTFFKTCLELIKKKKVDRKTILVFIGVLNEINLISIKIGEDVCLWKFLQIAMKLYVNYTKEDNYPDPIYVPNIVSEEKMSNPRIILEELHFRTLKDITSQYFTQPEDKHKFIPYIFKLLKEQLSETISKGEEFREDSLDWALTLFDISKYFLICNRFVETKNHFATANYIINRFHEETLKTINQETEKSKLRYIYMSDSYNYACGIYAKCWGTYGVLLLRFWLERFLQHKNKAYEMDNSELEVKRSLLLFSEKVEKTECMSRQITHTRVLNLNEAKSVFVRTLKYFDEAKEYFDADSDLETHAKIILQVSAAYKYLAGFEPRKDIQLKLHKQRVAYLENVCKKFHVMIDIDTEFQTYKRVWYEMVTSCSTVMDLMLEETYHNEYRKKTREIDQFAKLILGNINLYLNVVNLDTFK